MSLRLCEPKVYLVGTQTVNDAGLEEFLNDHKVGEWTTDAPSPGEVLVETGGRVCYLSFGSPRPGGSKAYTDNIHGSDHTSVLEHAVYTVMITGVSRSLTHELVRHRHASFSQLSQRYVDSADCGFVVPPALREEVFQARGYLSAVTGIDPHDTFWATEELLSDQYDKCSDPVVRNGIDWLLGMAQSKERYARLADYLLERDQPNPSDPTAGRKQLTELRKAARQTARSVLPNATETKLQVTANAHAWRFVLYRRGSRHADTEVRNLAVMVWKKLVAVSPHLFGDIVLAGDTLNSPHWKQT